MTKKTLIFQRFLNFFVLVLFFLLISCQNIKKNCEIKPDLERIGESAQENIENLSETELRALKGACTF